VTAVVPVSKVRAHLERQQLPSPARIAQQAHWWSTDGAKGAGVLLLKLPLLVVFELRPIFRGLGRVLSGWASWCAAADHAERLTGADDKTQKAAERLESRKEGRRRLSLIVFVVLVGVTWWAVVVHPEYLVVAGFVVVAVLDWAGRRGQTTVESLPPPLRVVLKEGVPLSQITASLLATFEREGIEVGVDQPLRYDAGRSDYRILVSCRDEITAEHLRALERGIGASDHTIRLLATGIATVRELVIRDGDPLAEVPQPDWIPTGTRSIESGALDLGESMTEVPFALDFAGVHIRIVAGTGGGKTAWFLRNCIDRLSSCRDAVLWGVDITAGPELPLWRAVIQRRAFTPEDAEELLTAALVEIDRRAKILAGFAADDDPSNDDITEWCSQLGPWLVIVIDEFSTLAEYNGKPAGELDLLKLAKQIIRTGRKHGVSLVMFAQRTGTEDFGSTVMSTQAGTAIVGPCDMTDTVNVFGKDRRDQGYAPHLLTPGTKESANDAGKCYVDSPRHRTADLYRAYAPLSAGEVKRRARQRIADGLPSLHGGRAELAVIEAAEVPVILADVEQAFADAGNPDKLATADLLAWLNSTDYDLDAKKLADQLRPLELRPNARWRPAPGVDSIRGYNLADVRDALGRIG
jgi:hypothetical protein